MSTVLGKVHIIPVFGLLLTVRLPMTDITVFGEHKHVAAFLVYVDDFLAAGPREILQALLTRLLDMWKGNNPYFLG